MRFFSVRIFLIVIFLDYSGKVVHAQSDFGSLLTSLSVTSNLESAYADYTMIFDPLNDGGTNFSFVTQGSSAFISFPLGTNLEYLTSMSITVNAASYPILVYSVASPEVIVFDLPMDLPAQTGFTILIQNVQNAPIESACGAASNTYFSVAPCDQYIYMEMPNISGGTNYFHHFGIPELTLFAQPYFVDRLEQFQTNMSPSLLGIPAQEICFFNVEVSGSTGVLPTLQNVVMSMQGSTDPNVVANVRLYATGSEDFFHSHNDILLGTSVSQLTPISFNMNHTLAKGDNFFFLVYDLNCDNQYLGDVLDGRLLSIQVNGTAHVPVNASCPGSRLIQLDYSNYSGANLVPNPGFETYASCPTSWFVPGYSFSNIGVPGWEKPTNATPDYFNACHSSNVVGVPINFAGVQPAHSGDAYAGIGYQGAPYSEYIQIALSSPLVAGQTYALNFFVSSGETDGGARNGIGAYLSNTMISAVTISDLPYIGTVVESSVIADQVDWFPVSGAFTASGGEQWLIIGNWYDPITITVSANGFGYMYVDDVSLVPLADVSNCPMFLSVNLIHFDAWVHTENQIMLEWSVSAPEKCASYIVERRQEDDNWQLVDKIACTAGGVDPQNYSIIDWAESDELYYRLSAEDENGMIEILDVKSVRNETSLEIYPNPVDDELWIRTAMDFTSFEIVNTFGTIVHSGSLINQRIDCSRLNSGIYLIRMKGDEYVVSRRFLKR